MVLMDMPDIEPFFSIINCLLIENGVFVFSIQHPCFNSEYTKLTNYDQILISDYIDKGISKGIAIQNQPEEQFYFHRPISYYMNLGFSNNLVVSGFTEPTFECNNATEVYNRIPPILFIRMTKK